MKSSPLVLSLSLIGCLSICLLSGRSKGIRKPNRPRLGLLHAGSLSQKILKGNEDEFIIWLFGFKILGIVPIHSVHTGCRTTQGVSISDFAPIPEVIRGVPYVPIRQIHAGCRMTIGRNRDDIRISDFNPQEVIFSIQPVNKQGITLEQFPFRLLSIFFLKNKCQKTPYSGKIAYSAGYSFFAFCIMFVIYDLGVEICPDSQSSYGMPHDVRNRHLVIVPTRYGIPHEIGISCILVILIFISDFQQQA